MKIRRRKGFYSISAVAEMFTVHQQTIRLYEKEGLLNPKRSEGNTRLFSEEDIDRLEEIIYLTHELGINLAGIEMIFKLKKQISKMQKEMNKVFEDANNDLDSQAESAKKVVKARAQNLLKLKQETKHVAETEESSAEPTVLDVDNWDIEYEE